MEPGQKKAAWLLGILGGVTIGCIVVPLVLFFLFFGGTAWFMHETAEDMRETITVRLEGRITEAGTGDGIGGATVVILKNGVTVQQWFDWLAANDPSAVWSSELWQGLATTNAEGAYFFDDVPRSTYGMVVTAPGFEPALFENGLDTRSYPAVMEMSPIDLARQ